MNTPIAQLDQEELTALQAELDREYQLLKGNKMSLDLSRGKPAADQLALSDELDGILAGNYKAADGTDVRNYGNLRGLPEARALGEEIMSVPAAQIIAGGNSSLSLMHHTVSTALHYGIWGDDRAWSKHKSPKLLTPVPGYDRHFVLTKALGIETINIDMRDDGPDMQQARDLVANDPSIKGIWCVPKYSNPTGCIYSDEVVEQLANLSNISAADDFVVLWDNAYAVHDLKFPRAPLASIYNHALQAGSEDHIVQFASTSKITFAGAGIAFLAASDTVLAALEDRLSVTTIGADKVNQLRHAKFLGGRIEQHMQKHAALLQPKFDIVEQALSQELDGLGVAEWTKPKGGYFVSLDLQSQQASHVIQLAKEVGLTLTPANSTFPDNDPLDRNVRIAPTYAATDELKIAMQILILCVKLSSVQARLASSN